MNGLKSFSSKENFQTSAGTLISLGEKHDPIGNLTFLTPSLLLIPHNPMQPIKCCLGGGHHQ